MHYLIRFILWWGGGRWKAHGEQERTVAEVMATFVGEKERPMKDGLFSPRYRLEEIKQILEQAYGKELKDWQVCMWVVRPHRTNYYTVYRFRQVSRFKGMDTLFGISRDPIPIF